MSKPLKARVGTCLTGTPHLVQGFRNTLTYSPKSHGGHRGGYRFLPFAGRRRQTKESLPPQAVQVFLPIVVSRWARNRENPCNAFMRDNHSNLLSKMFRSKASSPALPSPLYRECYTGETLAVADSDYYDTASKRGSYWDGWCHFVTLFATGQNAK